jgi:hypothetical protein
MHAFALKVKVMLLCSFQLAWHWPLRKKACELRYHSTALPGLSRTILTRMVEVGYLPKSKNLKKVDVVIFIANPN